MNSLLLIFVLFCTTSYISCQEQEPEQEQGGGSKAEKAAGEAIGQLLQEKIGEKFKEAANDVKGVLVKQLGQSLETAHTSLKQNAAEKEKPLPADDDVETSQNNYLQGDKLGDKKKPLTPTVSNDTKSNAVKPINEKSKTHKPVPSGAAVHLNKGPRRRKNSGPVPPATSSAAPSKPKQQPAPNNAPFADTNNNNNNNNNFPSGNNNNIPSSNANNIPSGPIQNENNMQVNMMHNMPPNMGNNQQQQQQHQQPNMGMVIPMMNNGGPMGNGPIPSGGLMPMITNGPMAPMPCGPSCPNNCCAVSMPPAMCPMNCNNSCLPFCPPQCCRRGGKKSSVAKKSHKTKHNKKKQH